MGLFNYGTWPSWILNPIGNIIESFNKNIKGYHDDPTNEPLISAREVKDGARKVYNDVTGQSQIDQQFDNNKALALYQTQLQEELYNKYSSPEALMRQYKAAGLNPNLIYGGAGSGQSNVPSYNAPSAPLNMSYTDKFNKALSMMSNLMNAKNLVYSTIANKEAAEQSFLRTLRLNEALKADRRNNLLQGLIQGYTGGGQLFKKRYSRLGESFSLLNDSDNPFLNYANAARTDFFNKVFSRTYENAYKYGKYSDLDGNELRFALDDSWSPAAFWDVKNREYAAKMREFDVDWNKEYKTMLKGAGIAAPIVETLLKLLGGKK